MKCYGIRTKLQLKERESYSLLRLFVINILQRNLIQKYKNSEIFQLKYFLLSDEHN